MLLAMARRPTAVTPRPRRPCVRRLPPIFDPGSHGGPVSAPGGSRRFDRRFDLWRQKTSDRRAAAAGRRHRGDGAAAAPNCFVGRSIPCERCVGYFASQRTVRRDAQMRSMVEAKVCECCGTSRRSSSPWAQTLAAAHRGSPRCRLRSSAQRLHSHRDPTRSGTWSGSSRTRPRARFRCWRSCTPAQPAAVPGAGASLRRQAREAIDGLRAYVPVPRLVPVAETVAASDVCAAASPEDVRALAERRAGRLPRRRRRGGGEPGGPRRATLRRRRRRRARARRGRRGRRLAPQGKKNDASSSGAGARSSL